MSYRVVFSPEAAAQIEALHHYIADAASAQVAERYIDAIIAYCESLCVFPLRGTKRDDVRPGLRVTNYKKRVVIAFAVEDGQVSIIGIYYGGQDYETALSDD